MSGLKNDEIRDTFLQQMTGGVDNMRKTRPLVSGAHFSNLDRRSLFLGSSHKERLGFLRAHRERRKYIYEKAKA